MRSSAFLAACFCASLAQAAPSSIEAINKRAAELLPLAAEYTGYSAAGVQAFITIASPEKINRIALGANYNGRTDVIAVSSFGLVILPEGFALGDDDYILFHELVHILQYNSDAVDFDCMARVELEAYKAQERFVEETGTGKLPGPLFMVVLEGAESECPAPAGAK